MEVSSYVTTNGREITSEALPNNYSVVHIRFRQSNTICLLRRDAGTRQSNAPTAQPCADLRPQRQRDANGNKRSTTTLIDTTSHLGKPLADAIGQAGYDQFDAAFDDGESARQDDKLSQQAARRIDELRQKGGKKQNDLTDTNGRQSSLAKQRTWKS